MTVSAPHPPFIEARWYGGKQSVLKWIVMHSTVSPCRVGQAKATAYYFAKTDRKASAHYVQDPKERYQCVPDHNVAWHCGYNYGSIAVEMCEFPNWDRKRWDDEPHREMERRAARLVARLTLAYNIRPFYVPWPALLLGVKGVTTHRQMSLAFRRSTHWDPGAWRRRRFMKEVRRQRKLLKAAAK